jgi:hypothetical protein
MMPNLKTRGICALVGGVVFVAVSLAASTDVFARGGKGGGFSRGGHASSGAVHSGNRGGQRDARRDRGDNRRDARGGRGANRGHARRGRADNRRDERRDFRRRRAARALTMSAFRRLSCTRQTIIVAGITYYGCGSAWYTPTYQGTEVVLVIRTPPGY